jgi:hypothetical protein
MKTDRRAADNLDLDIAATDKAERAMVEIIGVEIIHGDRHSAGPHEWVDAGILIEEQIDRGGRLMGEIAPDRARPGLRIIRLADAGEQHQADIIDREGTEIDEVRGLEEFLAGGIDIGDAGRVLTVA